MKVLKHIPAFTLLITLSLLTAQANVVISRSIYTQTQQGTYPNHELNGSNWTTVTSQVNRNFSITEGADFSNLATLQQHDAVWVDQELGGTLSTSEVTALTSYVSGGGKIVLMGENSSWNAWNTTITSVVGGSHSSSSPGTGTPLLSNALTTGITSISPAAGSIINTGVGDVTNLFSNSVAGLYTVGAGEALVVLDANLWDDSNVNSADNLQFVQNVSDWLAVAAVPEPSTYAMMGIGALAIGIFIYRRRNA